jgi:hypothetical protein
VCWESEGVTWIVKPIWLRLFFALKSGSTESLLSVPKLSDFEAEPHFMMQNILLKQQF